MHTRLKEVRKAAGYKQQDAAEAFGVSLGTYRNWEQGRVIMNGEQLIEAARLFNSNVDYILMTDVCAREFDMQRRELDQIFDELSAEGRAVLLDVARSLSLHISNDAQAGVYV